ncbi:MAG TPA: M50 family metallopeptidase [Pyrinomonadaceae bacterium]|jgi:Zn-dependent protease
MRFLEVFKRRFLLMHVSRIPVWADYRWVFVLALIALVSGASLDSSESGTTASYLAGLLITILFFASVLVHELAHAALARFEGVDVLEIVLHPFGGLARLRHEPETPRAEFCIAAAGPAASFALALLFVGLMAIASAVDALLFSKLLFMLATFNFLICVFNLFPGYPLDGGRLLRAYLWRSGRDINEATILTGRCGQVIGGMFVLVGLFLAVFRADFFTGFWMILIGLFLYDAAASIIKETRKLARVRLMDVMMLPVAVAPDANLLYFVDHILPINRQAVFPVAKDHQLFGMLLLEDLKAVPRERWHQTLVQNVMRAVTREQFIDMTASVSDARAQMRENGIGAVGVLDNDGQLVGFLGGGVIRRQTAR